MMDEVTSPFQQNELSAEDLAILHTFHALEQLPGESSAQGGEAEHGSVTHTPVPPYSALDDPGDLLLTFAAEADEDIAALRKALADVERDDSLDSPGFFVLQRTAHKLKGTAGAMGCIHMSTIAYHIEKTVKLMRSRAVAYLTGAIALVHAIHALEVTLQSIVTDGQESAEPLRALEEGFQALDLSIAPAAELWSPTEETLARVAPADALDIPIAQPTVRVDEQRLAQLLRHTEQLVAQHAPLERAQQQVDAALQELHTAQARLRRLEALFATLSFSVQDTQAGEAPEGRRSTSSLVAQILKEEVQRTGHVTQRKNNMLSHQPVRLPGAELWDEMEIDRSSESNVLAQALSEAIADVATASSQLRLALSHLDAATRQQMAQAMLVRHAALQLPSAPLSTLAVRLQRAIDMVPVASGQRARLKVSGEATELDQQILDALTQPFSLSQGVVQGLLLRVNQQQVIVPYSQLQRIDYQTWGQYSTRYLLNELLDQFDASTQPTGQELGRPALVLYPDTSRVAVEVDEVLGEVEMVMRPLSTHLQRAGITGAAIDGMGNVLLVLDLPELVRHYQERSQHEPPQRLVMQEPYESQSVLIADDSLSIRQSLRSILQRTGYIVSEAHDGLEALERILENPPHIILLDIEMPNLNGYDLLSILRANPQLAGLKIVMLTSRSSQKHQERALAMGAHAYLLKPCPQETLLETLQSLVARV